MEATRNPSNDRFKHLRVTENGKVMYTTTSMPEDDYIHTDIWKKIRMNVLLRDNFKCVKCGSAINVEVHHIRYPAVWGEEELKDLVTLCDACHEKIHNKNGEKS